MTALTEWENPNLRKRSAVQGNKLIVETMEIDDHILKLNQKLRGAEAVRRGDQAAFQPKGAEHAYVMQVPTDQWSRWCRQNPDRYHRLMRGTQAERLSEAARLQRERPQWFVQAPSGHHFIKGL
jgi:hypothetical protein